MGGQAHVLREVADGIGTPDPNPKHLAHRCFESSLIMFICSKLVIWGSGWGRGFIYIYIYIYTHTYVYVYIYI